MNIYGQTERMDAHGTSRRRRKRFIWQERISAKSFLVQSALKKERTNGWNVPSEKGAPIKTPHHGDGRNISSKGGFGKHFLDRRRPPNQMMFIVATLSVKLAMPAAHLWRWQQDIDHSL